MCAISARPVVNLFILHIPRTNMEPLHIRDITADSVDTLIELCIRDKMNDPLFREGALTKKKWAARVLETCGSFAKVAYFGETPVGMLQYMPHPDENILEIQCIFVPDTKNSQKGIGTALLQTLLRDVRTQKTPFRNLLALVTYANEIPGLYPQHEFYLKREFKRVGDDPFYLYYPLQEGYLYAGEREFTPQEEDEGRILIFYDPSCPFCVFFNEKIKESIREVTDTKIILINKYEESEEVKRRGKVPFCAVNKKPIETFFLDKENFQSEVMKALTCP